jgi:lysophospholipase L1-like esterase
MRLTRTAFLRRPLMLASSLGLAAALLTACDDGGGGDKQADIGDNRAGVVVALGDSITNGVCVPAGAPYPARLAALEGKTVINAGVCGDTAQGGRSRVGGLLAKHKPEALLILLGANDVIKSKPASATLEDLRAIVQAAKANKTRVLLANLPPMITDHSGFGPAVTALNPQINALAKAEGVRLVNLAGLFANKPELLQKDGLHPSDSGTQLIAVGFADRL